MTLRSRDAPFRGYALAVLLVVAAALVTAAFPLLRERFTLLLFWPIILGLAWFFGAGPGLLATALSAVAAMLEMQPFGRLSVDPLELLVPVGFFVVMGVVAALLGRWRVAAEAELRESRDRFATVANAAPVLIWMTGPDRGVTYVNTAWLDFTGRALECTLGAGWLDDLHPEDRRRTRETYEAACGAGRAFAIEVRMRRADGAYRHVLARGVPRGESHGRILGYVGSCTDISEQREAVAAAQAARDAAEAANRAKDAFLANVSHELRAPLSPIITWVRMLRDGQLSPGQATRALSVIERNARMQAHLIEDLLDVSRIVEGKLRLQVRPVVLPDVVHHALDTIRPAAEAKNLRLHVALDTTVAAIPGDADRLHQVVWNLLSNAVKFTPTGGQVHVVLQRVDSHVEIAVSDTGVGIATAELPYLFERFWQADPSSARAHTGLGLGLAIVRQLVELHGGTVTAASPGLGRGSVFTVKLPVAPVAARIADGDGRRHPEWGEAEPLPPARLDGIRVLLVDDEPDANEALRVLLDACGAEVRVAGSASLAMEILGRWRPDVLLTDIGMPGEDGYALLAKVAAMFEGTRPLPAIALTAYASTDDGARLLAAGFRRHLVKPAEPGELTAAIVSVATDAR